MANGLYAKAKQAFLDKGHDLNTDDIRVVLSDAADYSQNLSTHDFLDDVPAGARVAVSSTLGSPTITDGVFDTADFSWTLVSGDQSEQIIVYNHTGGADSARGLLVFYDTGITGMPVTPSGGDINGTVHSSGWFAL